MRSSRGSDIRPERDALPENRAPRVAGVGLHRGPLHGKPAKLLALDVGLARIGIAVCDPLQLSARPLATLYRASRRADFAALAETIAREEIQAILCGLPLNMDGSEGPQAATTRKWALRLAQALRTLLGKSLPIIFWDERLSSFAAQEILQGKPTGKQQAAHKDTVRKDGVRKGEQEEDAVAAAVILQNYLDHLRQQSLRADAGPSHSDDKHQDGPHDAGAHDANLYDSIILPEARGEPRVTDV